MSTPWTTLDVRAALVQALRAALIGPFTSAGADAAEVLAVAPSRWYACGFLAPESGCVCGDDPGAAPPCPFPSFIGLSVLVPGRAPGATLDTDVVRVRVRYADYISLPVDASGPWHEGAPRHWQRVPRRPLGLEIPLDPRVLRAGVDVPESRGLIVTGTLVFADVPELSPDTRALSLFLINRREPQPGARGLEDEHFAFQVSLELTCEQGLLPWPPGCQPGDIRSGCEHAVGHGVAVEVDAAAGQAVTVARTRWLPELAVPQASARDTGLVHVAVAAPGHSRDAVLTRVCEVLLGAAARSASRAPADADPYMTLFVGAWHVDRVRARIETDVAAALAKEPPLPLIWSGMDAAEHPFAQRRSIRGVLAVSGREDLAAIARVVARLSLPHDRGAVDVAVAPAPFLIGAGIPRLALCVLAGPPQGMDVHGAAAAIMADVPARPGLVVTVLDPDDPRERAVYERFLARSGHAHQRSFEPAPARPFPRAAYEPEPAC